MMRYETVRKNKKLNEFKDLVLEKNKVMNLTTITDDEEFYEKHFWDSLIILEKIDLDNKNILDLGTGAGFPGIPLAIVLPHSTFTLVETTKKKCDFLNEVVEKLRLKNVTIINERVEDLRREYRGTYDFVLSRAVCSLRILLELGIPYVKIGGMLVAYKSAQYEKEINEAKNAMKVLDCTLLGVQEKKLPISNEPRFNIIIKKNSRTDIKYPRLFSQIKKRPL